MKKLIFSVIFLTSLCFGAQTISKKAFDTINKTNEFIEKEQYSKAKKFILASLDESNSNKYELSYLYQTLSSIYYATDNIKKVIELYEKIIALNALEPKDINRMKLNLSGLYLNQGLYKKSNILAKSIENTPNLDKENLYETILYSGYYLNKYTESITYGKRLLSLENTKEKESWYKILYSSYIEKKDNKNAIIIMEKMLRLWNNNEDYWMQLASLYENEKQSKKAIATLEIAFKKEILTKKNNILYYVSLLLNEDLYIKSANVLEYSFKHKIIKPKGKELRIYISSLVNAKEIDRAISKLESSNLKHQDSLKIMLANLYYTKSQYQKSIDTLVNAKIRDKKHLGEKYILLGVNYYEINKKDLSAKNLRKATKYKQTRKKARSLLKELKINS